MCRFCGRPPLADDDGFAICWVCLYRRGFVLRAADRFTIGELEKQIAGHADVVSYVVSSGRGSWSWTAAWPKAKDATLVR